MGGGGGQQGWGGGDIMAAIGRMGFGGPSTTASGGDPSTPIGGIDIPPADLRDPFGEPRWAQAGLSPGANQGFNYGGLPGYTPPIGSQGFAQGPTSIPTFFNNQGYPYAVPVNQGDYHSFASIHFPQKKAN